MRTIIKGYTDSEGLSGETTVADVGVNEVEKYNIMETARRTDVFPKGIKRLRMYRVEDHPIDEVAFISEEVSRYKQSTQETRQKEAEAQRLVVKQALNKNDNLAAARRIFDAAARKRNEAIAALAAKKNILSSNINKNSGDLLEKDRPAIIASIEKLQPLADAATRDFETILAAFNVVKNPNSTPEETEKALIDLGIKKTTEK